SSWDKLLNEAIDDSLRTANVYPEEIIESDHREFCLSLAERGRAVAALPQEQVADEPWCDSLVTFGLEKPVRMQFFAVWLKGNEKMMAIRQLKQLLQGGEGEDDPELQIKVSDVPQERLH